jgi:hypothetical protein
MAVVELAVAPPLAVAVDAASPVALAAVAPPLAAAGGDVAELPVMPCC